MRIIAFTLSLCLYFSIYTSAQQPHSNTTATNQYISSADSLLNENDGLEIDSLQASEEALYKNEWNTTQIKYPANVFPDKNDTVVITLVGQYDRAFVAPVKGEILSKFGIRHHRMHTGTDIRLNLGDTVRCAFDGRVRLARRFSGYGNLVLVRHNNGLETIYAHLSAIKVKVNDTLKAGDLIGLGGRTGRATCTHLHFETRLFGEPFDSNKYIDFNTFALSTDKIYYKNHRLENDLDNFRKLQPAEKMLAGLSPETALKHVIKRGDTLSHIAQKYHTSVKHICSANQITAQKTLKIGSVLLIN
jgi:hypothetical protein